jgi:hypothetical protein
MTEQFPGQGPDQSIGAMPTRPSKGRWSGIQPWIGVLVVAGGIAADLAHDGSQRLASLLGGAVGLVLVSVTFIVFIVRRSRSQQAANMNYGRTPGGGQDNLASPGYGMPGYAPPGPQPPRYRVWLVASTVLGAIGLVGIIVCTVLIVHTSSSQPNYNNPSVVAASIKTLVQQRLSDQSGQYYDPGVTVTSVACTPSGTSTDHCAITLSNGQTGATTAVILANGRSFRTQ